MLHLTNAIDRATGYVYVQPSDSAPPGASQPAPEGTARAKKPNEYALFTTAAGPLKGTRSDVRDVQERWIDARDEWDAYERHEWRREGEAVRNAKTADEVRTRPGENKIRSR